MWSEPTNWAADDAVGSYLMNKNIRDNLLHLYSGTIPQRAHLFHDQSYVVSGNAITAFVNNNQAENCFARQEPSALYDSFSHSVWLMPGIYRLAVYGVLSQNSGILRIVIAGAPIPIIEDEDLYNAGGTVYHTTLATGYFAIAEAGINTLLGSVDSKNAGSGGYDANITYFAISPDVTGEGDY
jgi:hypothetical protein